MNLVKSSGGKLWKDDNLIPEAKKVSEKMLSDGTKAKIVESFVPSKKTGGAGVFYEKKRIMFADSDSEDEDDINDYQDLPSDAIQEIEGEEEPKTSKNEEISDLDFLRSKMVSKDALEPESDSEDIEEEDEEELEEESKPKSTEKESEPNTSEAESDPESEDSSEDGNTSTKRTLFDDDEVAEAEENVGETGRLFVRNLAFGTLEEDLVSHFSRYGELAEVRAIKHFSLAESTDGL